jgi:type II secretory pathway component PulM
MKLRTLTKREQRIATVTLLVAVSAMLYAFVLEPVTMNFLQAHRRSLEAQNELALLRNLIENRETIEREYRRLRGAVTSGKSEQALKVALFDELDQLAANCGLDVIGVKPIAIKEESGFSRYGAELQIRCEGHKFVKLLHAIQEPEHMLHVEQLSVTVGPSEPPLTVNIKLSKLAKVEG